MGIRGWFLGVGGAAFTFGGGLAMAFGPDAYPDFAQQITGAGVIIALLGLGMMAVAFLFRPAKEAVMGDNNSIKTGNISHSFIGKIGHDFHGPTQRKMDDALRHQILNQMPRNKPIKVVALLGDGESCTLAVEIHAYLKAHGFSVEPGGISQAVFGSPVRGLVVHDQGEELEFIVGHA